MTFVLFLLTFATFFDSYPLYWIVTITAARIMLIGALFFWALWRLHRREVPTWNKLVVYWIGAVVLFDLSTCFYSVSWKFTLQSVGVKLEPLLLFLLLADCFRERAIYRKVFNIALIMWVANAAYAVFQELGFWYGFPTEIPFLQAHITLFYYQSALLEYFTLTRARSLFHDPNSLAGYLAMYLPLLLALALSSLRRPRRALFWLCLGLLGAAGALVTYSRSGLLAVSAGVFAYFVFASRRTLWKTLAVLLGPFLVVAYFLQSGSEVVRSMQERMNLNDPAASAHISDLLSGYHVFLAHPLLGVGYGGFQYVDTLAINPHDIYLQFLAETGIVGFALELTFIVGLFLLGWRRLKKSRSAEEGSIAAAWLAGFCALLAFNLTYWFYYNDLVWFFLALYLSYENGILTTAPAGRGALAAQPYPRGLLSRVNSINAPRPVQNGRKLGR